MRAWLAGALWVVAMGCVEPPGPREVELPWAPPVGWSGGSGVVLAEAVPSGSWWMSFGDEGMAGAIEEALGGNPDLEVMGARLEAAAAGVRMAGADLYPGLDLGIEGSRTRRNFIGFPLPGGGDVLTTRSTAYRLSLSSAWEVDLWGRVRAGRKAALAEWQAAGQDYRVAYLSLAARTARGWIDAIAARRQSELARRTAASYRRTAERIRERYERGLLSSLDLRLALNSAEKAEALSSEQELEFRRSVRRLEVLLGRYPSGGYAVPAEFPSLRAGVPAGMPSDLLGRRPDIRAAERRLAAADERLWQAKAAFFPRISLTASGGTTSAELENLADRNLSVWTLASNMVQPLFEGGRLLAGVDRSRAEIREGVAHYFGVLLQAFREVEAALEGEAWLAKRERHLREAGRQSEAALALANRRYESGLIEFINVLESQRRALIDAGQVIEIRRRRLENRLNLHLALGGGFPGAESGSVGSEAPPPAR